MRSFDIKVAFSTRSRGILKDHNQKKRELEDAIYENLKGTCAFPYGGEAAVKGIVREKAIRFLEGG